MTAPRPSAPDGVTGSFAFGPAGTTGSLPSSPQADGSDVAPTHPSRRGACPALTAPMMTGDGLLVRVNTIAGSLPPKLLIGLCELALRHGNGIVEVTARGSFQIRGLSDMSAHALAADVNALAIPIRNGVPIDMPALAGLDRHEIADARPLVDALRTAIEAAGLAPRLGPKVSVVVDGGGHSALASVAGDVRLTAGGAGNWALSIGGDAASARPLGVLGESDAAQAALAILTAIADVGIEARGRDLADSSSEVLDVESSAPPPSGLPAISPSRGEIKPAGHPRRLSLSRQDATSTRLISPLEGEMAGRPEGGVTERNRSTSTAQSMAQKPKSLISPLVGEMSGRTEGGATEPDASSLKPGTAILLTDNRLALPIALPFGSAEVATLIALAEHAVAEAVDDIRLAPNRQMLLLCPSQAAADALRNVAAELGFITSPADPRSRIAACPGAPACASGLIATRNIAQAIAAFVSARPADDADTLLSIHVSGCAKGCARQATAAITLVGDEKGAGLVVAGTARDMPIAYTKPERAAHGITDLLDALARQRRQGEDAALTLARLGPMRAAELFAGNDHDGL
jgi:precorrin-3B synthase